MRLAIIVPTFNEEQTVEVVVRQLLGLNLGKVNKQVIVVDDCSSDRTLIKLKKFKKKIEYWKLPINLGKGGAIRMGLSKSRGDIAIICDADLEMKVEEIKKIIEPIISKRSKVVYGSRFLVKNELVGFKTKIANLILTRFTNLLYGTKLTDMETAWKAFDMKTINQVLKKLRCVEFDFEPEVTARLAQLGVTIEEVPISYLPRSIKEGKHIRWIDGLQAVWVLLKCRLFKDRYNSL